MRSTRFAATLLAGLVTASCSDAASGDTMTAEETVAFILFGLKDGVNLRNPPGELSPKKLSASPLALEFLYNGKKLAFVRVEKRDDCHYNATMELTYPDSGETVSYSALYDLSGLKSASVEGNDIKLDTVGVTCPADNCAQNRASMMAEKGLHFLNITAPEKRDADLTAAVEGFRKNICTGGQ